MRLKLQNNLKGTSGALTSKGKGNPDIFLDTKINKSYTKL